MGLKSEVAEIQVWPSVVMHYYYMEVEGPFHQTAGKLWGSLYETGELDKHEGSKKASFYKLSPTPILRAGYLLETKEATPSGLKYELINPEKRAKYAIIGSYSQLPVLVGKVWELVKSSGSTCDSSKWTAEYYANSPADTKEEDLITEVLIPVL